MASNDRETERRPLLHRNHSTKSRKPRSLPSSPSPAGSTTKLPSITLHSNSARHLFRARAASVAILLSLVFERTAFYGLAGNLVLFLNKNPLLWQSYNAINASLYFYGVCFVMSLVGGWLADAFLGRFKAIVMSFVIYMAGYLFMPVMAAREGESNALLKVCWANKTLNSTSSDDDSDSDAFDENCAWMIFLVLTVIAVGTGFVKANIAPFGSDQVTREGQQATLSFFNWFYWCLNLGALLGLSVITYIEQDQNFFMGYLISVCCLVLSTVLFVAGRCFYHVREPDGSILTNIMRIVREACRRKQLRKRHHVLRRGRPNEVDAANSGDAPISFLDYAKHRHGGIFHDTLVEDVKQLKKIFAVFAVLIPYWLVYFQMQTSFLVQGLHMRLDRPFTSHILNRTGSATVAVCNASHINKPTQMVAAWLSLFDVIVLVLLLPLFDRVIYPWLERRSGVPISISRRILLGMVFAVAAMVVAGVVEHFRLEAFWSSNGTACTNSAVPQYIDGTTYEAADMSILWQIPQYALIGLSEVFTSVAGLQFAVSIAPRSMKGIIMGLFYLFSGAGSFLGTAVVFGLSSAKVWFLSRDFGNINCRVPCKPGKWYVTKSCHLDYYFYLLAGIEGVGAVLFMAVSYAFRLDEHHRQCRVSYQLTEGLSGEFIDAASTRHRSGRGGQTIQRSVLEEAGD